MISSVVVWGDDVKASEYNNLRSDQAQTGVIVAYPAAAPTGWLLCNGAGLDTTTYAALFAVIGYAFGGSGSTFNIPDLQDRFPVGRSGTKSLGATGGSFSITLVQANLPSHSHTLEDNEYYHNHTAPTNSAGTADKLGTLSVDGTSAGNHTTGSNQNPTVPAPHTHGGSTGSIGSGTAFSSEPPRQAQNYIIKY